MPSAADQAVLNAIFDPNYSGQELITKNEEEEITDSSELTRAKQLEIQGVQAAESGDMSRAIAFFNQAIDMLPNRASGYNNRAQALRLMGKNEEAMEDLNKAIGLNSGRNSIGRINALCQRALLFRLKNEEEKAFDDLKEAASAGNDFAKRMLVQLNPYSALCNQMLQQMLQKLNEIQ